MKRYDPAIYRDTTMALIGGMKESLNGEYIEYEDVQELLQWMKEKAKYWEDFGQFYVDNGDTEDYSACADELKEKLREIGEL